MDKGRRTDYTYLPTGERQYFRHGDKTASETKNAKLSINRLI